METNRENAGTSANGVVDEEQTLLNNDEQVSHHSGTPSGNSFGKTKHLGMLDVVRHPEHNKAVLAVVMVMIAQQLTGTSLPPFCNHSLTYSQALTV